MADVQHERELLQEVHATGSSQMSVSKALARRSQVFILPPPGAPGLDRTCAEGVNGLRQGVVGQVVALMGRT